MTHLFRTVLLLLVTAFMSACSVVSPTLGHSQTDPSTLIVEGNTFHVYSNRASDRIEAHRVNFLFPLPPETTIVAQAQVAMKLATGCEVKPGSVQGDHAIVKAMLNCEGVERIDPVVVPAPVSTESQKLRDILPK